MQNSCGNFEASIPVPFIGRQHLGLLNIPNKVLLNTEFYYPQVSDPSYADIQLGSLDIFMSSINQLQLKERTRSEILREQYESQFRSVSSVPLESKSPNFNRLYFYFLQAGSLQITPSKSLSGIHRITFDLRDPRTAQVFGETCLVNISISYTISIVLDNKMNPYFGIFYFCYMHYRPEIFQPIDENTVDRILARTTRSDDVKTKYGDFGTLFVNCAFDSKFETVNHLFNVLPFSS